LGCNQRRDPFAQKSMIIDGENSNRIGACSHGLIGLS
jgi:hypothetical protein